MKLLCVAGFLGSGKTTLLLEVARSMTASGLKLAVIESEVGGGVRDEGLPVRELFGGCICCTLQTGLANGTGHAPRRRDDGPRPSSRHRTGREMQMKAALATSGESG